MAPTAAEMNVLPPAVNHVAKSYHRPAIGAVNEDGYTWLKYGEKRVANSIIRSYYRCVWSKTPHACPAKKTVDVDPTLEQNQVDGKATGGGRTTAAETVAKYRHGHNHLTRGPRPRAANKRPHRPLAGGAVEGKVAAPDLKRRRLRVNAADNGTPHTARSSAMLAAAAVAAFGPAAEASVPDLRSPSGAYDLVKVGMEVFREECSIEKRRDFATAAEGVVEEEHPSSASAAEADSVLPVAQWQGSMDELLCASHPPADLETTAALEGATMAGVAKAEDAATAVHYAITTEGVDLPSPTGLDAWLYELHAGVKGVYSDVDFFLHGLQWEDSFTAACPAWGEVGAHRHTCAAACGAVCAPSCASPCTAACTLGNNSGTPIGPVEAAFWLGSSSSESSPRVGGGGNQRGAEPGNARLQAGGWMGEMPQQHEWAEALAGEGERRACDGMVAPYRGELCNGTVAEEKEQDATKSFQDASLEQGRAVGYTYHPVFDMLGGGDSMSVWDFLD